MVHKEWLKSKTIFYSKKKTKQTVDYEKWIFTFFLKRSLLQKGTGLNSLELKTQCYYYYSYLYDYRFLHQILYDQWSVVGP